MPWSQLGEFRTIYFVSVVMMLIHKGDEKLAAPCWIITNNEDFRGQSDGQRLIVLGRLLP
jgi:hypothetical protein